MRNDPGTKIFLIRHGETANAAKRCYNGHNDIDLSQNGITQIQDLADRLSIEPITAIYSSDLQRSRKGAKIIAGRHSLEVKTNKNLREISYGRWEGLSFDEIKNIFPDETKIRWADIVNYRIQGGGENLKDLHKRIIPEIKKIISNHSGETIALLLHGGVNKVILGWALQMDLKYINRITQKFAALNIVTFYKNGEVLIDLTNG